MCVVCECVCVSVYVSLTIGMYINFIYQLNLFKTRYKRFWWEQGQNQQGMLYYCGVRRTRLGRLALLFMYCQA